MLWKKKNDNNGEIEFEIFRNFFNNNNIIKEENKKIMKQILWIMMLNGYHFNANKKNQK